MTSLARRLEKLTMTEDLADVLTALAEIQDKWATEHRACESKWRANSRILANALAADAGDLRKLAVHVSNRADKAHRIMKTV